MATRQRLEFFRRKLCGQGCTKAVWGMLQDVLQALAPRAAAPPGTELLLCHLCLVPWLLGSAGLPGFSRICFGRQSFQRILFGKGDSCLLSSINVSCVIAFRTWKTRRDLKLSFTSHSLFLLFASISAYFEPFSFCLQAKHWSSSQAILQSMVIHACLANNCNITGQNTLYSPGNCVPKQKAFLDPPL